MNDTPTNRIVCRTEDIERPLDFQCAGLRVIEIGTERSEVRCTKPAEWWVGDYPACSDCVATFLDDEEPTGVAPILSQPTPTINECKAHRCRKHYEVPMQNHEADDGSECGGCILENQR